MPKRAFSPLVDIITFDEGSKEQQAFHDVMDAGQIDDDEIKMNERAEVVAHRVHVGQLRKDGKTPYIMHPAQIAGMVAKHGGSQDMIDAAWLHDTQEEGGKPEDLVGFSDHTKLLVNQLTKQPGQDKTEYMKSLKNAHPDAVVIKTADRIANLQDGEHVMPPGWMPKYLAGADHVLAAADHHGLSDHPLVKELRTLRQRLTR